MVTEGPMNALIQVLVKVWIEILPDEWFSAGGTPAVDQNVVLVKFRAVPSRWDPFIRLPADFIQLFDDEE